MTDLPTLLSRATPGPWFSVRENVSSRGPHVCRCYRNDLSLAADCNAALIALAPQLAAALIEARKAMTELQRDMLERSRAGIDAIYGEEYRIVNAGRTAWHDFCATLTRIDAIMNPGGGALKGD